MSALTEGALRVLRGDQRISDLAPLRQLPKRHAQTDLAGHNPADFTPEACVGAAQRATVRLLDVDDGRATLESGEGLDNRSNAHK